MSKEKKPKITGTNANGRPLDEAGFGGRGTPVEKTIDFRHENVCRILLAIYKRQSPADQEKILAQAKAECKKAELKTIMGQ